MVKARRAKTRPSRVVIPVVIALLVGVGVVALQQGWLSGESSTTANPSPAATSTHATGDHTMSMTPETSSASATPTDDESSATPRSPSPTRAGQAGAEVAQALEGCQDKVRAADRVLKAADVGIGHWAEHVQAQTDANSGKISVKKMNAIFKRTRLDGPDDVKAYDRALDDVDQSSGSCDEPEGATGPDRDKIKDCAERSKAQRPVLAAAEDGMDDWESHLAAMRRSRMGHVNDAEGVWIRAWRAAPPHIKAYEKAAKDFDAPRC